MDDEYLKQVEDLTELELLNEEQEPFQPEPVQVNAKTVAEFYYHVESVREAHNMFKTFYEAEGITFDDMVETGNMLPSLKVLMSVPSSTSPEMSTPSPDVGIEYNSLIIKLEDKLGDSPEYCNAVKRSIAVMQSRFTWIHQRYRHLLDYKECEEFINNKTLAIRIGKGSHANVYMSLPGQFRMALAVKEMALGHFRIEEAESGERLSGQHDELITCLAATLYNGRVYLFTPSISDAMTLHDMCDRSVEFPIEISMSMLMRLFSAAACMHDRNVSHNDIHSRNVLIADELHLRDRAYIIDYGLAEVYNEFQDPVTFGKKDVLDICGLARKILRKTLGWRESELYRRINEIWSQNNPPSARVMEKLVHDQMKYMNSSLEEQSGPPAPIIRPPGMDRNISIHQRILQWREDSRPFWEGIVGRQEEDLGEQDHGDNSDVDSPPNSLIDD